MNAPVVRDREWQRRYSVAQGIGLALGDLLLTGAAERAVQIHLATVLRWHGWRCVPPEKRRKGGK